MSKTLEELGYEKEENRFYIIFRKQRKDYAYLEPSMKEIVFDKPRKEVFGEIVVQERLAYFFKEPKLIRTCFSMEELKAIYKYCEDNKWI